MEAAASWVCRAVEAAAPVSSRVSSELFESGLRDILLFELEVGIDFEGPLQLLPGEVGVAEGGVDHASVIHHFCVEGAAAKRLGHRSFGFLIAAHLMKDPS